MASQSEGPRDPLMDSGEPVQRGAYRGSVPPPDLATESRLRVVHAGHALGAVLFHCVAWPYARVTVRLKKSSRSGFEAARNNEQLSAQWRHVMNREKACGDHCPIILA